MFPNFNSTVYNQSVAILYPFLILLIPSRLYKRTTSSSSFPHLSVQRLPKQPNLSPPHPNLNKDTSSTLLKPYPSFSSSPYSGSKTPFHFSSISSLSSFTATNPKFLIKP
ncbi:hypothetical protein M6B38_223500 [Iris pallida]|uniref:Uncharacterized protein n=1 Tax=Iris pallida TaxID=29817 RepID=A0AAX6DVP3_IRIPA|nr:hypothetical protein M6B38_223500 [Iris pallida]